MRISDWSSDVCSSDLRLPDVKPPCSTCRALGPGIFLFKGPDCATAGAPASHEQAFLRGVDVLVEVGHERAVAVVKLGRHLLLLAHDHLRRLAPAPMRHLRVHVGPRSERHTSELQSLMSNSNDVFCLQNKTHE